MAITNAGNGTAAPVVSTPLTLVTVTDPGVYVLTVDLSSMLTGDIVTFDARMKALSGGTLRTALLSEFAGAQALPVQQSVPVLVEHECSFVVTQTAGTARTFAWSLGRAA
jgi:hypothetical protein